MDVIKLFYKGLGERHVFRFRRLGATGRLCDACDHFVRTSDKQLLEKLTRIIRV